MVAKRKCSGCNKNAFFASCSSSTNVAIELDSSFASAKHQECEFNRAWKDEFPWLLFTTEYAVKSRNSSKFYANMILLMIFIVNQPV